MCQHVIRNFFRLKKCRKLHKISMKVPGMLDWIPFYIAMIIQHILKYSILVPSILFHKLPINITLHVAT